MPPNAMLALIVISLALSITGLAYWIGPRLAQQGQDLASTLAQQFHVIRQNLEATLWGRPLARSLTSFDVKAAGVLAPAETAARLTVSMLAGLVVLLVTTLYMAISPNLYVEGVLGLLPIPHRPRAREIMTRVTHVLRFWFLGQVVDMFTVGALAAAGLYLLHVPAPYALGVLTGLLTFIPYFGTVLVAILVITLALTVGWSTALWALVVYFACHVVEGYVVAPLVQRRLIELPPAMTILSMMVMGTLFGPLGVLVGTPLAAAIMVVVQEAYIADVLHA